MSKRRKVLYGIAAGALFVFAVFPATAWIVRRQIGYATGYLPPYLYDLPELDDKRRCARERVVAAQNPADFPLQLAAACRQIRLLPGFQNHENDYEADVESVRSLRARYDDCPSLHANLLIASSAGQIKLPWYGNLLETRPRTHNWVEIVHNSPSLLAEWDAAAGAGERLDPDNAFFPMMRALGLYAARRDTEADAALLRAADKPRWNDYGLDKAISGNRLNELAYGEPGFTSRALSLLLVTMPHLSRLRTLARLTTVRAMNKEMSGDIDGGIALRCALLRCGAVMRSEGTYLAANATGSDIAFTARLRPGGAKPIPQPDNAPLPDNAPESEKALDPWWLRKERINRAFLGYLKNCGAVTDARWVQQEIQRENEVNQLQDRWENREDDAFSRIFRNARYWVAGQVLLANVLFVALLGVVAAFLSRTARVRRADHVPFGIRLGLGAVIFSAGASGVVCACQSFLQNNSDAAGWAAVFQQDTALSVVTALAFLAAFSAACWLCRMGIRSWGRKMRVEAIEENFCRNTVQFAAGILLCTGVMTAAWFVGKKPLEVARSGYLPWAAPSETPYWPQTLPDFWTAIGSSAIVLAIPLFLLVILAVVSGSARIPAGVGIVRGVRGLAGPTAAVVLILYVVAAALTAVEEARNTASLHHQLTHQGRYSAALLGKKWPRP